MKRHPTLVSLSHEHHHGLVQARRLRAGAQAEVRSEAATAFLQFFGRETVEHFREEEERLFPLLAESDHARESLTRALLEHQRLHALVARLHDQVHAGEPEPALMTQVACLLEAHIRYEERELFPLIERSVRDLQLLPAAEPERGHGPVWGTESEELNATILEWSAGDGPPEHVNDERDVLVVVLDGAAEVAIGDHTSTLRSGEALIIPRGESRQISAGPHGVRYLSAHRRRPPLQIKPVR